MCRHFGNKKFWRLEAIGIFGINFLLIFGNSFLINMNVESGAFYGNYFMVKNTSNMGVFSLKLKTCTF
jgi:hypothetical protein